MWRILLGDGSGSGRDGSWKGDGTRRRSLKLHHLSQPLVSPPLSRLCCFASCSLLWAQARAWQAKRATFGQKTGVSCFHLVPGLSVGGGLAGSTAVLYQCDDTGRKLLPHGDALILDSASRTLSQ